MDKHPNRDKEFVVTKRTSKKPSKSTNGEIIMIVARNMKNNNSYVVWPDTTFNNFQAWDNLKLGDIFTNVSIFNEELKRLNSRNTPQKTGYLDSVGKNQDKLGDGDVKKTPKTIEEKS